MAEAVVDLGKTKKRRRPSAEELQRRERLRTYLTREWEIDESIAKSFAKKHSFLLIDDVVYSLKHLTRYFKTLHMGHYGHPIEARVLRRALNHTLRRFARSQSPLSDKQLGYFLQLARDEIASKVTSWYDPGSPQEREKVLYPLKQALIYEDDEAMKKRLLFIYTLFVKKGMRLAKQKVIQACTNQHRLFPHRRVVEDALETLRGAYEALGFIEGELFITPDYISVN
ncbi:MAG: hypothetical protein JXR73_03965 [Candidatus Omnitrophica bacterium]|nr:hypothetical protein [Candidatus Omnitrophota bacterium]